MFDRMTQLNWILFAIVLLRIGESEAVDAVNGQLKYQASLREANGAHYCGGAILSARWVVTSAKCVYTRTPASVMVGSVTKSTGGTTYSVTNFWAHPLYLSSVLINDIGLVKTSADIAFNANVQPIKLAEAKPADNSTMTVSGWGTIQNTVSENLRVVNQTVMPYMNCIWLMLPVPVTPWQFCTIGEGFCVTDSGGPVVSNGTLYGIASFTPIFKRCAANFPDASTKVSSHKMWISMMQKFNSK